MNQKFKIFLWAAVHDSKFNLCYFRSPIWFRVGRPNNPVTREITLTLGFRKPQIFVPWQVEHNYRRAKGEVPEFDDIPF